MTFQTPGHAVRFCVVNHRHMVDRAVAAEATDSAVYVGGMIVKDVIRCAMDLNPLDGLARLPAVSDRFKLGIVLLHLGMAIHTSLGVR